MREHISPFLRPSFEEVIPTGPAGCQLLHLRLTHGKSRHIGHWTIMLSYGMPLPGSQGNVVRRVLGRRPSHNPSWDSGLECILRAAPAIMGRRRTDEDDASAVGGIASEAYLHPVSQGSKDRFGEGADVGTPAGCRSSLWGTCISNLKTWSALCLWPAWRLPTAFFFLIILSREGSAPARPNRSRLIPVLST